MLNELISTAKSVQHEKQSQSTTELKKDRDVDNVAQPAAKRGRWDDGSDSDEDKKKKKKEKKMKKQRLFINYYWVLETKAPSIEEMPEVTVSLPGDGGVVDDYYATHPLLELPPDSPEVKEEIVSVPQESILPCRSVNNYEKIARLNEGSYGVVYKAKNIQTGEIVALKRVYIHCFH